MILKFKHIFLNKCFLYYLSIIIIIINIYIIQKSKSGLYIRIIRGKCHLN